MKIIVPLASNAQDSAVNEQFARAPFFMIYDSANGQTRIVDNPVGGATGGAGVSAAQWVIDQAINAVITPRLGSKAGDLLKRAKVAIYQSTSESAEDNVKRLIDQQLNELHQFHSGFHHG